MTVNEPLITINDDIIRKKLQIFGVEEKGQKPRKGHTGSVIFFI